MQYSVTPAKRRKNKNNLFLKVLIVALLMIISVIMGISLYLNSKQNIEYNEKSFYLVSAAKSKNLKEIEDMKESAQKLGGAGKVYLKDGVYYLILNAYLDLDIANEIIDKNREIYKNAEIIEIKTKKISNRSKRFLKNHDLFMEYLKIYKKYINEVSILMLDYLAGNITENKLASKMLSIKFDFDDFNLKIAKFEDSEINNLLKNNINLAINYFSVFFNSFFAGDKNNSVICEFFVNFVLLMVEFFNNL